jgi:hypothetical protein
MLQVIPALVGAVLVGAQSTLKTGKVAPLMLFSTVFR